MVGTFVLCRASWDWNFRLGAVSCDLGLGHVWNIVSHESWTKYGTVSLEHLSLCGVASLNLHPDLALEVSSLCSIVNFEVRIPGNEWNVLITGYLWMVDTMSQVKVRVVATNPLSPHVPPTVQHVPTTAHLINRILIIFYFLSQISSWSFANITVLVIYQSICILNSSCYLVGGLSILFIMNIDDMGNQCHFHVCITKRTRLWFILTVLLNMSILFVNSK